MEKSVGEMYEDYVKTRLRLGGCALTLLSILACIVMIYMGIQSLIEYVSKNWGTDWPLWLILSLLILTVVIAVLVHKNSKKHPTRNTGIALAFGAFAFTLATVFVFIYKETIYGALYALQTLVMWFVAFSYLRPKKNPEETTSN